MTTLTGTTTKPATQTAPTTCPDCGNPTRTTYIAAADLIVPGLWECTTCPAHSTWPPTPDYRCQ